MTEKISIPGEDGEEDRWANLRSHSRGFKSGERRKLYEFADTIDQKSATGNLEMMHRIAAHIIEDWYLDAPYPRLLWADGRPTEYVHIEAFDQLDTELEDLILAEANWWMQKIAIN